MLVYVFRGGDGARMASGHWSPLWQKGMLPMLEATMIAVVVMGLGAFGLFARVFALEGAYNSAVRRAEANSTDASVVHEAFEDAVSSMASATACARWGIVLVVTAAAIFIFASLGGVA